MKSWNRGRWSIPNLNSTFQMYTHSLLEILERYSRYQTLSRLVVAIRRESVSRCLSNPQEASAGNSKRNAVPDASCSSCNHPSAITHSPGEVRSRTRDNVNAAADSPEGKDDKSQTHYSLNLLLWSTRQPLAPRWMYNPCVSRRVFVGP